MKETLIGEFKNIKEEIGLIQSVDDVIMLGVYYMEKWHILLWMRHMITSQNVTLPRNIELITNITSHWSTYQPHVLSHLYSASPNKMENRWWMDITSQCRITHWNSFSISLFFSVYFKEAINFFEIKEDVWRGPWGLVK